MPTTTNYALRYPALSDAPNVPQDMSDLASDADAQLLLIGKRPFVQLILAADQSTATGLQTAIFFGSSELYDTHGYHSPTFSSRITPGLPGLWRFDATVLWQADPDGERTITLAKNGASVQPSQRDVWNVNAAMSQRVGRTIHCNGTTDYVELMVYQTAGNALNVLGDAVEANTSTGGTMLEAHLLRPL